MERNIIKTIILLCLLTPLQASAHSGHNHSDGLHQTIATLIIITSIIILLGAYGYIKHKRAKKKTPLDA